MFDIIQGDLKNHLDAKLVDELLAAYQDMKHNFYIGGLRLSEVEAGRFCEAAFRILEEITTGKFTALSRPLDTEKLILALSNSDKALYSDSVRLHIPRSLRVVYDIRNKRDAAHLADDIDPNLQDATLVVSVVDWVLSELIRIYHGVSATEAQQIIESLVTRKVPAIEDFDGFLKVLKPSLQAGEYVLLILYGCGKVGAQYADIEAWVRPKMRKNLKRTLDGLIDEKAFVHASGSGYMLTRRGIAEVEKKKLHHDDED